MASIKNPTTGKPRGRVSLLTAKRVDAIITAIERGNFIETAATLAGVSKSTYTLWRRRGEVELRRVDAIEGYDAGQIVDEYLAENEEATTKELLESWADPIFDQAEWPYVVFAILLTRARAIFIDKSVTEVWAIGTNAQRPNWQAVKWLLEVTQPEQYGDRKTITHEGNPEAPLVMDVPSASELIERIKLKQAQKNA